jgi:transposase InsO family protein
MASARPLFLTLSPVPTSPKDVRLSESSAADALPGTDLDFRALDALAQTRNFTTETIRVLLRVKELVMLGTALALGQWRESRDPVSGAYAEHCQAEMKCAELRERLEIISGRLLRMPAAQRKRYTPEERYRIVVFVRTYGLSLQEAADAFLVDPGTIGRWIREAGREPDRKTVGSLLKASPPLQSLDEVTRELIEMLDRMRVGGSKRIAQLLVRVGRKVSTESVRRHRKNRRPRPAPSPQPDTSGIPILAVRAKEPNHVWMTDLTNIPSLFKLWTFKLVVVLDVFSRFPLVFKVFSKEPTSEDVAALVADAARRFGSPKHFVTDRGSQFTGEAFQSKLQELGARQRFGAIGKSGSIAIIERFWRTVKEMLDSRFMPPISISHLEQRLDRTLFHYATLRPHQGLGGATPTEVYFRQTTAHKQGSSPSRASPLSPTEHGSLPFRVAWLDDERRLPFLVPTSRAA